MDNKVKAYGLLVYKIKDNTIKILLCKSVKSLDKWGCLKGLQRKGENSKECAIREFHEESSIFIPSNLFEKYFYQENKDKDIGIWLVNGSKIKELDKYFIDDKLCDNYLSWENSKVKFFDIKELPKIKKKQKLLISEIKDFLENKNRHH